MRSVKTKLFVLICGTMVGIFVLLSSVGVYYIQRVIEENSARAMNMLAEQRSRELNVRFQGIERAVGTLEEYITENADAIRMKSDALYMRVFMREVANRGTDTAKVAGNVVTCYFHLEPSTYGGTAGVFLVEDGSGEYAEENVTDILQYDSSDREHVGWYYEPVESGKAIWMQPYLNKNINLYMISYVAPVYVDGKLLGVVGMDVDMAAIYDVVESVDYENGFGFLLGQNGSILYHPDFPEGLKPVLFDEEMKDASQYLLSERVLADEIYHYTWRGEPQRLIAEKLENGMIFAISVPEREIMRIRWLLWRNMFLILAGVLVVVLLVLGRIMRQIIRPIQELTKAASRIAKGEMNVPIKHKSRDEIGQLADSIRIMSKELREYIAYVHGQAYTDAMTGVGNKTAYMDVMKLQDRKVQEGMAEFAVVVFDVNGLKRINDNLGHECGDKIIIDAANVLKRVFGAEHAYRIGGDEFIVVLETASPEDIEQYFSEFDETVKEMNQTIDRPEMTLAVSKGAAFYMPEQDKEYREVFKRADEEMYKDKERFYQGKNDRRRR